MKLIVPYVGALQPVDIRLIQLAEFLGIRCEPLAMPKGINAYREFLSARMSGEPACCVVNLRVIRECVASNESSVNLVSSLLSCFTSLVVHGIEPGSFDDKMVSALSGGWLCRVQDVSKSSTTYEVSPDSRDVCASFAGLSLRSADQRNDRVFSLHSDGPGRTLISLNGEPLMVEVRTQNCHVLVIGSEDVADLTAEAGDRPVAQFFPRLLPYAIALRHIFKDECWLPSEPNASVIIDDPLLRPNYGFLNFEHLLALTKQHNFHVTVAFIPHNFRRSSRRIATMFQENADRLSLCFHGNDHTGGEFASTDRVWLNTISQIAETRMMRHYEMTGLPCDRVMVFPQGRFSVEAMLALRARNFDCAVNTVPYPKQQPVRLTLGELMQPAVLRYGFPLFLRRYSAHTQDLDMCFDLFWGRPILIVEHHDIFRNPAPLISAVSRINESFPQIRWTSVGRAVKGSFLKLRQCDGTLRVRAYSREVQVSNRSDHIQRLLVQWDNPGNAIHPTQILANGIPVSAAKLTSPERVLLSADLNPNTSANYSLVSRDECQTFRKVSLRRRTVSFMRRRLSEVRDNYIERNSSVMAAAKAMQRGLVAVRTERPVGGTKNV